MVKKITKRSTKTKIGKRYSCKVCGLAVIVDRTCGCVDACDIVCCGEEMRPGR
jgi:hypothetical protein